MTSKEALERLYLNLYSTNENANYYDLVLKALERLEVLDKLVTDDCIAGNEVGLQIVNNLIERSNNYRDENKQLKERLETLEKENKELEETIEIRKQMNINLIDFGTKLKQENEKLKKALDILKGRIEFEDLGEMQSGNVYRPYFNDCLDQQEYELLKEVLE